MNSKLTKAARALTVFGLMEQRHGPLRIHPTDEGDCRRDRQARRLARSIIVVRKVLNEPLPESATPPPMLNWAEREAGLPGQPPLPGLADGPTLAERAFIRLPRHWA